VEVDFVRPYELTPSERALWLRWQEADPRVASPFLTPAFASTAGRVRADARVGIVSEGTDVVAFWPVSIVGRGRSAGPVVPGWTDLQGMVPSRSWRWADLLQRAGLSGWKFDHLAGHQAGALPGPATLASSPAMDLSEGWEAYEHWLMTEHKRRVTRQRSTFRRAEREHRITFIEADPSEEALSALVRMKTAQCRQRGWADIFADPSASQLVTLAAAGDGDGMRGLVSTLRFDGEIAAAALFLDSGHTRALWINAFDGRWSRSSPGTLLLLEAARAAAAGGRRRLSLGKGDEDYKRTLGSVADAVASGSLCGSSPAGRLFAARTAPARATDALLRRSPAAELTLRRALHRARRIVYHQQRATTSRRRVTP
jgi:CelD/BcsL family acetyltransferase involved in cellulose biosynthesis